MPLGLPSRAVGSGSATFSLGVLTALARRSLLPQVDYLSTVSGGGYLGAFLTTFLNRPEPAPTAPAGEAPPAGAPSAATPTPAEPAIGLGSSQLPFRHELGEAAALRYVRHHSRYLSSDSLWGRMQMAIGQIYGLSLNVFAFFLIVTFFAIAEYALRSASIEPTVTKWLTIAAGLLLIVVGAVLPALTGLKPAWRSHADCILAVHSALLAGMLLWQGLGVLHSSYRAGTDFLQQTKVGLLSAGIPIVAIVCLALIGRRFLKLKVVLIAAAAVALLFFLLGTELVVFDLLNGPQVFLGPVGIPMWPVQIAIAAWLAGVGFTFSST
jgi:hypothetical protein